MSTPAFDRASRLTLPSRSPSNWLTPWMELARAAPRRRGLFVRRHTGNPSFAYCKARQNHHPMRVMMANKIANSIREYGLVIGPTLRLPPTAVRQPWEIELVPSLAAEPPSPLMIRSRLPWWRALIGRAAFSRASPAPLCVATQGAYWHAQHRDWRLKQSLCWSVSPTLR